MKRTIFISAALVFLNLIPTSISLAEPSKDTATTPKLIVVKYDAEWCYACQELSKITPALQEDLKNEPVLFLTLDIGDEEAVKQSRLHAAALGIQEDFKKMEGRTGLINVLDATTKKRLTQLDMTHSAEDMAKMIREHL